MNKGICHKNSRFCIQKAVPVALFLMLFVLILGCQNQQQIKVTEGVSLELAEHRAKTISDVQYGLHFSIPDSLMEPIAGKVEVAFQLSDLSQPLVLDFFATPEKIQSVTSGEAGLPYTFENGHIVIESDHLQLGENRIEIDFIAGEGPLNRTAHYLYTLFVPDRAAESFPCFDQPNVKARFALSLELPAHWLAVANGSAIDEISRSERKKISFEQTAALPTYLFSFAAGEFERVAAERDGRILEMFHRETDRTKIEQNLEAIFDLHAQAINWLEAYTGIPYPFSKFGFVLVPSFQYGGMEHPGAILYRASRLLLDASATQSDVLGRASLIAHETAHIWFGDLVTMNWFNDVWMKEVFANFTAAKITNPAFPELNHDLRFLFAHYPAAYEVDRTAGANPIRQQLGNLNEAGSLYGAIIYQKAPIVMRQLEKLVGEELFRDGIRNYLSQFAFANATWPQLIEILDALSDEDLQSWSHMWVGEPAMPYVETELEFNASEELTHITVRQSDPQKRNRHWGQNLTLLVSTADSVWRFPVALRGEAFTVEMPAGPGAADFVLANGDGTGYGYFTLDEISRTYLLQHGRDLPDPVLRATVLLTLWEELLHQKIAPAQMLTALEKWIATEKNNQIVQRALGILQTLFWQFHTENQRQQLAPALETLLWQKVMESQQANLKSTYFRAFRDIAISDGGLDKLTRLWQKELTVPGLPFSENDFTTLAMELAVRDVPGSDQIVQQQIERIENQDRAEQMRFVAPALHSDADVRDAFFLSLHEIKNRHRESWVLTALRYLHHPLRAEASQKHLRTSLELLAEIQRTGDIFFPKRWLDATFGGYNSASAAEVVRQFLRDNPDYLHRLRGKILQSTDMLFRSAKMLHGWQR